MNQGPDSRSLIPKGILMSKSKAKPAPEKSERELVSEAIHSLFRLFERPRYGSYDPKTPEIRAIEKQIRIRKRELERDPKLASLEEKLSEAKSKVSLRAAEMRQKIESLIRRLNLHGVTPALKADIAKIANEKPIVLIEE